MTWSGSIGPTARPGRFRYDAPTLPGYMTRMTLLGTDGSERVEGAWEYNAQGNVVRTWRGSTSPDSGVELYSLNYTSPHNPVGATVTDPLGKVSAFAFKRDPASNKRCSSPPPGTARAVAWAPTFRGPTRIWPTRSSPLERSTGAGPSHSWLTTREAS